MINKVKFNAIKFGVGIIRSLLTLISFPCDDSDILEKLKRSLNDALTSKVHYYEPL